MGETDFHITLNANSITHLRLHFKDRPDAYVAGDILLLYEEGNPKAFVVPDVMVFFGTHKATRASYKLWKEQYIAPSVVIEVASAKTVKRDLGDKKDLYQRLGVNELYITDPMQPGKKCLKEPLIAYWLENGRYVKQEVRNGRIFSPLLGLELVHDGATLRFYDPVRQRFLPDLIASDEATEAAEKRAQAAEALAAEQEKEIARLRALLEGRETT